MAYTAPTAADLKDRYPEFASVGTGTIDDALQEAALFVDDSWPDQGTFTLGRLLYAAHILAASGLGDAQAASGHAGLILKSEKSGDTQFEYAAVGGSSTSRDDLLSTSYGKRFRRIQRALKGGARLVRGDAGPSAIPEGW
jgi:hypothetical protein